MLTLILPPEQTAALRTALVDGGRREVGGVLMGEHVDTNEFVVRELTVHRPGYFASFLRRIEDALGQMRAFFARTGNDYLRYNYLGEWHSHPSFAPIPSTTDDRSMLDIVQDSKVGANFVVLVIAKLEANRQLVASAHVYLPDGSRMRADLRIADSSLAES